MSESKRDRWEIYRLSKPREQVGMPSRFKWAVGLQRATESLLSFYTAFETRAEAREFVSNKGHCFVCGFPKLPKCGCELELTTS